MRIGRHDLKTRETLIEQFLHKTGWGNAVRHSVQGDASSRAYERLTRGEQKAVLMNAPFMPHKDPYSKAAKLAGSDPNAFLALATALTRRGFSAPHILAADMGNGLLMLEDLGNDLFAQVLADDISAEAELYAQAIDCLAAIYRSSFADVLQADGQDWHANWPLRHYDQTALQTEADLLIEWYIPEFSAPLSEDAKTEWYEIWQNAFKLLQAHAPGLALRDFHAENIFWLPERDANAKIGLIDFQDALIAHPAYDLVSLLEDARRDVDPTIVDGLISRFCTQAGIKDDDSFRAAYAVMGAQRNAKILGIFVRLARRDGKQHYLDFIPRVAVYFRQDIAHPALSPLQKWCHKYAPTLVETGQK